MNKEEFIKNIKKWDWKAYKNNYSDLKGMNCNSLLNHVFNYGIKEKRNLFIIQNNKNRIHKNIIQQNFHLLLPNDFEWKYYISLYSDLQHMNENDAKIHYVLYGNYEERTYKNNNYDGNYDGNDGNDGNYDGNDDRNNDDRNNDSNLEKFLKLYDDSYVLSTEHRGGWKSIISSLYETKILTTNSDTYLIDLPARTFVHNKEIIKNNFFMFVHETINIRSNIGYQENIHKIINSKSFLDSASNCLGIITFSDICKDNIIDNLKQNNKSIPVLSIKHPVIFSDIKYFDIKNFIINDDTKIILLGSQLRQYYNIYTLKTKKKKLFFPGTKVYINEKIKDIKTQLQEHNIEYDNNILQYKYYDSFADYDNALISNIIIIDLIDANANNSVTECIARNLPFFINKIPAVIEYLGNDYPMYFSSKEDLEKKINNNNELMILYKNTHNYLKSMKKHDLSMDYFSNTLKKFIFNTKYNCINLFPIYFPQFHNIEENNINFYDGFTDYRNLIEYNKHYDKYYKNKEDFQVELRNNTIEKKNVEISKIHYKHNTPNLLYYYENNYDLNSQTFINKQVELAKICGMRGFSLYYFYFSENNNRNKLIMKDVINKFFTDQYPNFKIYFTWCNENWSDNIHFTKEKNKITIKNIYTDENIYKHFQSLISYFTHNNYYKINNMPVFAIHFPELLDYSNFWKIGNEVCKNNGFNGFCLFIKNINDYNNENIVPYKHHINYKNSWDKGHVFINKNRKDHEQYNIVDMNKYYEYFKSNKCSNNTLIFSNFNNNPRMIKPYKKNISACINNELCGDYRKKIFNNFDNTNELKNSICHINAWNEWGENMALEPSNENIFEYINELNTYKKNLYNLKILNIYLPEHDHWSNVEKYLEVLKSCNYNKNITLVPFYDIYLTNNGKQHDFGYENSKKKFNSIKQHEKVKPLNKDWIGIFHNPFNTQTSYKHMDIWNNGWYNIKEHLSSCKGIFCISNSLKQDIIKFLDNNNIKIPFVENLYHPLVYDDRYAFNMDLFWKCKNVYQIGSYLRHIKAIIDIEIPHEFKKHITPSSKNNKNLLKSLGFCENKLKERNITFKSISQENYNKLFENSIIFLNLMDATANNVVLECIHSNTPIIINRLPATIEYLGEDYPLFYDNYNSIDELLTYENILNAHNYLKKMNKQHLSLHNFVKKIYDTFDNNNIIET